MNTSGRPESVADLGSGAVATLADLCRPFVPPGFVADCEVVPAASVPAPSGELLVHPNHMTVELERFHGKPVEVRVLREHHDGDRHYSRQIGLTLAGTSRIVEWGIVRLDMKYLSAPVRDEILAKRSPLGAILIRHNVHRRIEPRHYVRFPALSPVIDLFGSGYNAAPLYGRLGTIFCDDEPAIELLEIAVVAPEAK